MVTNKLMTNTNQAMGIKVSFEIVQQVKLRMAELESPNDPYKTGWTQENLADVSSLGLKTIQRFLGGEPVSSNSLIRIMKAVGLEPESVMDNLSTETESNVIDWLLICEEVLDNQRDARELRRKATRLGAENNVYMPLDLIETIEKKQEQTAESKDKPRKRETEERIYPHAQFLEDLLNWQRENKHIAITGEAGAGKTTFLVAIAEKLKNSQHLPIFIGLADLLGRSLKTYINDVWLPHALNEREATEEQKESLFQQFQTGKIWLLLDALDEMQAKSSAEALERINREIKEIIGQSRVVMTCRLNVWDAYINRLPNFDTFRMENLSLEQIDSFISQWFSFTECPENAAILQEKLKEPNRARIRDMVTHPLQLALLCQAFYRNPNTDLPKTKAGLYELFVRYFYEWKPNIVDVDLRTQDSSREALHQALGKLAIAAIDSDTGFRLSRSFAVKAMDNSDLFNLACNVGWLSLIDRNDLDEEVYSFFHATFQEYFAALVIDEHSFFLENKPDDVISGYYQIFESKWLEVALFWIGIDSKTRNEKNKLIGELAEFKESNYCFVQFGKYFYGYQSIALAARLMAEYIDCSQDDINNVMWQLCQYSFGCFDAETQSWIRLPFPIQECAKQALINSNHARVKDELDYIKNLLLKAIEIDNHDDIQSFLEYNLTCCSASPSIGCIKFSLDNINEDEIVEILGSVINEIDQFLGRIDGLDVYTRYKPNPTESNPQIDKVIESLIKIDFANPKEIIRLIDSIQDDEVRDSSSFYQWFGMNPYLINYCIPQTTKPSLLKTIVSEISKWISPHQTKDRYAEADLLAHHFLWRCSELMNYKDFYKSWSPESFTEIADLSYLESQLIDRDAVQEELDRNTDHPEIRCLVVDVRQLEQERDPNVIAQKIANRIFDSLGLEIPVIQHVSILEAKLLNLKRILGVEKLAIALYGKSANEAIHQLCQNLVPIQTRLFTGGQTTQELITKINAWLSEM
jgi:energy-coupling factor transporter ATP-binding protein EcfA2